MTPNFHNYRTTTTSNSLNKNERVSILDQIENELSIIYIREDGIRHTHLKVEYEVCIEHAEAVLALTKKVSKDKAYPSLFTVDKFLVPNSEVREYMASERRTKHSLADGFVLHSLPQKIMGNFYLKFNSPPIPTQMFSREADAIQWLRQFVQK